MGREDKTIFKHKILIYFSLLLTIVLTMILSACPAGKDVYFALVRYNADGSIDNTFGNGGIVVSKIGDINQIYSLALQPEGKITAAGYSDTTTGRFCEKQAHKNNSG
ncbi:MAG: hypothetical protein ACP5QK_07140 [Myxococcota bacterium]